MTHKLFESRLIRLYLIAVGVILLVAVLNAVLTWWITVQAVYLADAQRDVPQVLDTVAASTAAAAGVGSAIATITTAIIARYGAREATRNLGHNPQKPTGE